MVSISWCESALRWLSASNSNSIDQRLNKKKSLSMSPCLHASVSYEIFQFHFGNGNLISQCRGILKFILMKFPSGRLGMQRHVYRIRCQTKRWLLSVCLVHACLSATILLVGRFPRKIAMHQHSISLMVFYYYFFFFYLFRCCIVGTRKRSNTNTLCTGHGVWEAFLVVLLHHIIVV